MDAAVGLVQAYLRLNGYFTVTEHPVLADTRHGGSTLTDVDVMAVRFPGAQQWIPGRGRGRVLPADPELGVDDGRMDMIIGEVKEGRARFNAGAYSPDVVEAVIRRFGCCTGDPAATARAVLDGDPADALAGGGMSCRVRMIVFAGVAPQPPRPYPVVTLRHIATFIADHLERHRDVFFHTELKDEVLDLMALLVKVGLSIR